MRLVLTTFAGVLLLSLPASAAPQQPLDLSVGPSSIQHSPWIEQQDDWPRPTDGTDIVNPFGGTCVWSVNDHVSWRTTGYLDPGASSSTSVCIVSDFNPVLATRFGLTAWWGNSRYGFFGATASKGNVSVCYSPQGRCFTGPFCGRANYNPDDPALTEIPDSRGGRGVVTTITLTVSNPTSKRIRDITVDWGVSSDIFYHGGCTGPNTTNSDYPFYWS